jgi:hypothetical protein
MKRGVSWYLVADVSGKHNSPVFKRQAEEANIVLQNAGKQLLT